MGRAGVLTTSSFPRTLVLTGHFPPGHGRVQTFTWELVRRLPPDRVTVVGPWHPEAAAFDARLPFDVIRRRHYLLFRDLRRVVASCVSRMSRRCSRP